jgi:hypothetical protein
MTLASADRASLELRNPLDVVLSGPARKVYLYVYDVKNGRRIDIPAAREENVIRLGGLTGLAYGWERKPYHVGRLRRRFGVVSVGAAGVGTLRRMEYWQAKDFGSRGLGRRALFRG